METAVQDQPAIGTAPQNYADAGDALSGGTAGQNIASAANSVQNATQTAANLPDQRQPGPVLQVAKPKPSVMSDILHAVASVLGGPSTVNTVDPDTGAITPHPLTRAQRIANTAGIYLRGAAAGAAQHGPGAVGKAAMAGVQEQQQTQQQQQENTLAQSANVRATNTANQEALTRQASLALMSQQQARNALDLKAYGMQLDANQITLANALQDIRNQPGVKVLGHYDSNSDINAHLEAVGPALAKQYAADLTKNNIRLYQNPKGGFDAVLVPKKLGETAIGPGHMGHHAIFDPTTNTMTLESEPVAAGTTWDQYTALEGAVMAAYNSSRQVQQGFEEGATKIALQKQQEKEAAAGTGQKIAETNLINTQAKALIGSQTADPFGYISPLPTKEALKRQDAFQKDTVNKAYDVEKAYTMSQQAYSEYQAAKAQGKELPTGAQSMLLLSQHLGTTFGNVKGSRITKDMIQEHLGARGISDDATTAIQRIVNGDQLSPAQWKAFSDLISQSRSATWGNAVSNAKNQLLPITFLPRGNGQKVIDKGTAQLYLDAANGDLQTAANAMKKQNWVLPGAQP